MSTVMRVTLLPLLAIFAMAAPCALAQTAVARQDPNAIRVAVEQFLTTHTAGLP